MSNRKKLRSEALEPRLLLDAQGVIWGADARLTLSFAPDGTDVNGHESALFSQFDKIAPRDVWQQTILTAFHTWARETNADIGVVQDDGSDFGIDGKLRRDERFGDIRVGSIPMGEGTYAVAISANEAIDGTWTGDLLFNSEANFQNLDELFAVAVHEAGHVFGLEHSDDPMSPLYSDGTIPDYVLPTPEDISILRDTFGPRTEDLYDSVELGDSPFDGGMEASSGTVELSAYEFENAAQGAVPTIAFADITEPSDVDRYKFEVPEGAAGTVVVHLVTSGISQLAGNLRVTDDGGNLLGRASTLTPGDDSSVVLYDLEESDEINVSVRGNPNSYFDVGGYSLVVWYMSVNQVDVNTIGDLIRSPMRYVHTDDVLSYLSRGERFFTVGTTDLDPEGRELQLETTPGFIEGTRYQTYAGINQESDIDRYRIETPEGFRNERDWARISLRSLDMDYDFRGEIAVYDTDGQVVDVDVVVSNNDLQVVQFGPVSPSSEYVIEVSADSSSESPTGYYELDAIVGWAQTERETFFDGHLTGKRDRDSYRLDLTRQQLFNFNFAVEDHAGIDRSKFAMRLFNSRGEMVLELQTGAGKAETASVYLPADSYRVVIKTANRAESFRNLGYSLRGASVDDPLGPRYYDPTFAAYDFRGSYLVTKSVMGFMVAR